MGKSILLSERKPKRSIDIHMFTAGDQISSTGQKISFSPEDLNQVIETYHPQQHEAPLIVGHDQDDATPALGWVKKVWRKGKELWGKIELTPKAEQLIEDGVFKKVSSSFYLPDAETNPYPGKLSLRHLALVTIPAVKGLTAFSEEDDEGIITVELSENKNFKLFKEALGIDSSSTMTKKKTLTEDFGEGMTININIGGQPKLEGEDGEPTLETGPSAETSDVNLDEEDLEDEDLLEDSDEDDEDEDEDDFDIDEDEDEEDIDEMDSDDDDLDLDSEGGEEEEDDITEDDFNLDSDDEEDEDSESDLEDLDSDSEGEDTVADLAANYSIEELEKALQMKKEEEGQSTDNYEYLENSKSGRVSSYAEKTSTKKTQETPKATATIEKKPVELSAEAKILQAKVAKLEEELARQKRVAREKEISNFAEGLYSGGKLTEQVVNKENLVKFMSSLNYKGAVNFSEGNRSTQLEFFKNMLEGLPAMVNFEEVATPASAPQKKRAGVNFSEPAAAGYAYDAKNLDLHQQALSYSESNSVDYVTALKTILSR